MEIRSLLGIGSRILGLLLLYFFFHDALQLAGWMFSLGPLRPGAVEARVLYGLLDLLSGIYLTFRSDRVSAWLSRDGGTREPADWSRDRSYILLFGTSVRIFGVYLFYRFMYYCVTLMNVAMGNYNPRDTDAAAFFIQAAFHLGLSLFLILKTERVSEIVFRPGDGRGA